MNIQDIYALFIVKKGISIDSRKINKGDIYFALKGENFNGNHFAGDALKKGAILCIVDEAQPIEDDRLIVVDDALITLQTLAAHHRSTLQIPTIAITGSNGKTTTKELVHAVLITQLKCYTTEGNLNNHIGIPLTILKIGGDADIAIVEMGANHKREIAGYCTYTKPTHGNITNCGKAHLEGFGSEAGIIEGKGELFAYLKATNGVAFLNNDYDYLKPIAKGIEKIISYGTKDADFVGHCVGENYFLEVSVHDAPGLQNIRTRLTGNYNLPNVLTAVCIGKTFGITDENIRLALENYEPKNSRSQIIKQETNTIIMDAYNANPSSVKVAIENLINLKAEKKVVMLGAMLELGVYSKVEHQAIVTQLSAYKWSEVLLVGEGFKEADSTYDYVEDSEAAAEWFRQKAFKDATILIKGSRGLKMENILK